jgi:hypothetical protein
MAELSVEAEIQALLVPFAAHCELIRENSSMSAREATDAECQRATGFPDAPSLVKHLRACRCSPNDFAVQNLKHFLGLGPAPAIAMSEEEQFELALQQSAELTGSLDDALNAAFVVGSKPALQVSSFNLRQVSLPPPPSYSPPPPPPRQFSAADPPDVDNMTEAELLALEDSIGHVAIDHSKCAVAKSLDEMPTHVFRDAEHHNAEFECQICLVEYETGDYLRTLMCFHMYHQQCIDGWLSSRKICPLCQAQVLE